MEGSEDDAVSTVALREVEVGDGRGQEAELTGFLPLLTHEKSP